MVHARLFGDPRVLDDAGKEVRLRSRKQLGVLLYLVVDGRDQVVTRDTLMEAFWEGAPQSKAYHSLCQAVTAIREAFGRDAVTARGDGLRLTAPVQTDIDVLAQELERRDLSSPLHGMEWWGGAALGHWLDRTRTRCRRLAEEALRDGIVANRRAGATLRVHRCAELLYELDPLSEPAVLALAERELLRGDVVGAIRLLRAHQQRVKQALDQEPPPGAVDRLLRRLEAGAHPPVALVPKRLEAHAARVRPTVLVGRERELAHLEGEWQTVHEGRGLRTCLITGPGGIGKSSLIRRFAATVAARAETAFLVSCQEMGEGIPFAAVADLIGVLVRDPAASATDPLWLAEVSRIQPAVRTRYPGVPPPMETPADTMRLRIAEGVNRMLEAITDGAAVAVLFDDLQYMDPATRDILAVLCRRAHQLPLLLVGTARARGLESGLPGGPAGQDLMPWTTSFRLAPLDADGTTRLLASLAPALIVDAPPVVRRIVELSEGNPQFTEMLLADWQQYASASLAAGRAADELPADWQPPDNLRQAFARLYAGLGEPAQQLLHILAVAQRALTPEEVSEALGRPATELDQAALEVLKLGVLRLDGGSLSFKNELHRAFAYFAIDAEVRKYYHAMLSRAVLRLSGDDDFLSALEGARHLIRSGSRKGAVEHTNRAARLAMNAGAPREAEQGLLELMSLEAGELETMILLADAQLQCDRPHDCLVTLSAAGTTGGTNHQALQLEWLRVRAAAMLRNSPPNKVALDLAKIVDEATEMGAHDIALPALQVGAELAVEIGEEHRLASVRHQCQRLLQSGIRADQAAQATMTLGFMTLASGQYSEAQSLFRRGLGLLGPSTSYRLVQWRLLNGLGLALTALGDYNAAATVFAVLEKSVSGTSVHASPLVWSNIAVFMQERGCVARASEYFGRALASLRNHPDPKVRATVLASAASFALDIGQFETADACLSQAQVATSKSGIDTDSLDPWLIRADFLLATGETELAWTLIRERVIPFGERRSAIGESARHERLLRHFVYSSEGKESYLEAYQRRATVLDRLPLHGALEVECFHEWVVGPGAIGCPTAIDKAVEAGLGGLVLHLAAVRTLPAPAQGGPSAALAVALFPQLFLEAIPLELGWCLPIP